MTRVKGLSFYKKRKKINSSIIREILSWIFGIAAAIFIAAAFHYLVGMSTYVVGASMEPTLYNEQKVFINRFLYNLSNPKAGDVVVFLPNGNQNTHYYIKRVAAVPGDTIYIQNGILYVNGKESELISVRITDPGIAENEFTLQSGEYFCIGDNPDNSEDSRSANIGPVKETYIIGKVWFHLQSEEDGIGFVK